MIEKLREMIEKSNRIVFFGGAGVSTESGIPDFRSAEGIYSQKFMYPPEVVLSHGFFLNHTQKFYEFYKKNMIHPEAKPNFAHAYLVQLEQAGKLSAVVTQNIDGLHTMAGSQKVYELHGSIHRNTCMKCRKPYSLSQLLALEEPYCSCSGLIKPDVVLYEESLPQKTVEGAVTAIENADMLIVAGTALAVYPAASFVQRFQGNYLVVINKTPLDVTCDLAIEGAVGETFRLAQGPLNPLEYV